VGGLYPRNVIRERLTSTSSCPSSGLGRRRRATQGRHGATLRLRRRPRARWPWTCGALSLSRRSRGGAIPGRARAPGPPGGGARRVTATPPAKRRRGRTFFLHRLPKIDDRSRRARPISAIWLSARARAPNQHGGRGQMGGGDVVEKEGRRWRHEEETLSGVMRRIKRTRSSSSSSPLACGPRARTCFSECESESGNACESAAAPVVGG